MSGEEVNKGGRIKGIYALCCPDTGDVKYIGQSIDIRRRFNAHKNPGQSKYLPVSKWCGELAEQKKSPVLRVIETCENLNDRETHWIRKYGIKNLLNIQEGGESKYHEGRSPRKTPWGKSWAPAQYLLIQMKKTAKDIGSEGLLRRAKDVQKTNNEMRAKGFKNWVLYNVLLIAKIPGLEEVYATKVDYQEAEKCLR